MTSALEKIIGKGRKALSSLGLTGVLLGSLYVGDNLADNVRGQDANAEVKFKFAIEDENHNRTNDVQVGHGYFLKVLLDNTAAGTNQLVGVEFFLKSQILSSQITPIQPNPYYTTSLGPDAFTFGEEYTMQRSANKVAVNNYSLRLIKPKSVNGLDLPREGPTNIADGVVGVYSFIPKEADVGKRTFNLEDAHGLTQDWSFGGTSYKPQFSVIAPLIIAVVPNPRDKCVVVQKNVNELYVAEVPEKASILQISTNLIDWQNVYTNDVPGNSFTFTYTNEQTSSRLFYRALTP